MFILDLMEGEKTDQAIKQSFICMFMNWVKMHIGGSLLFMFDFIVWLGCKVRVSFICVLLCFLGLWCLIHTVYFCAPHPFGRLFFYTFVITYKKWVNFIDIL